MTYEAASNFSRVPGAASPPPGAARPLDLLRCASLAAVALATSAAAAPPTNTARRIVALALEAQGGEARLREIRSVRWSATGYRNAVEQSERPNGPYLIEPVDLREVHLPGTGLFRLVGRYTIPSVTSYTLGYVTDGVSSARVTDGGMSRGTPELLAATREAAALSPERLLLTAAAAADLRSGPEAVLQSVRQDVLRFTLDGATVRIWLNHYTHLPTAVDYDGPLARDGYWRFVGDVRMRTSYGTWWLTPQGFRMPLQRDVERNGLPDTTVIIFDLVIDGPVKDEELSLPTATGASTTAKSPPTPDLSASASMLDDGVTLIQGSWNVTVVEQPDGIVVIEAPISSAYSARVLDWVGRRYPGRPVKAVVSTSDSWPHLAGVREYVARGIPVYCLDLNIGQIDRFLANPHRAEPDALAKTPRRPRLQPIIGRTVIGTGPNRLEIFPIRGETSERQLMVYLPAHRLLYGSDPFQRGPDGRLFHPQTVSELVDAVARERLDPTRFYMMHIGPSAWTEATAAARPGGGP